ncbi:MULTISPECIES: hypothetical protein [Demequina]|uniref:DUF4190 domain-containing protein n=1 Tax=Demequina litorisediminis TaxID=1849022 RepID=A0ABQ6IF42_9MICO|nr:hypothetical protein [Demequina litorisediminis]GMA36349.1 hypothetical protein GCM10025876_25530 [Demequina litorisediminis]
MPDTETPTPQLSPAVRRYSVPFMVLLGLTLLLYLFSIPLAYGMLLTGPAAAIVGLRALWVTRKDKALAYFRLSMTFGIIVAGFMTVTGLSLVVFNGIVTDLSDCMDRAVTRSAVDQCEADYQDALNDVVEDIYERFGVTTGS